MKNFSTVKADITNLQLPDGALDAMLTFNAIHHSDPNLFLNKAAKTLTEGGYVVIYTRLQSQNVRNIWGRYFPAFAEKENRLYRLSDIESWKEESGSLRLASINFFKYRRRGTLSLLLRQTHSKHYSTFSLYSAAEFDRAAVDFERNIKQHFSNPDRVEWSDENVIIVFKKGPTIPIRQFSGSYGRRSSAGNPELCRSPWQYHDHHTPTGITSLAACATLW